jgi:hypothetical protein
MRTTVTAATTALKGNVFTTTCTKDKKYPSLLACRLK